MQSLTDPCDEVLRLLSGDAALPAALADHARGCARCTPLLAVPQALEVGAPGLIEPGDALREALRHAAPVSRPSPLSRAAPTAVVVLGATLTALFLGQASAAGWLMGTALTLGAAAGFALVFARGRDGLGASPRLRRLYPIAAFAAAVLAPALAAPSATLRLGTSRMPSPGTAVDALARQPALGSGDVAATVATMILVSALSATAALLGARWSTPRLPALTGATLGAAAALLGLGVAQHGAALTPVVSALAVVTASALCAAIGRRTLSP